MKKNINKIIITAVFALSMVFSLANVNAEQIIVDDGGGLTSNAKLYQKTECDYVNINDSNDIITLTRSLNHSSKYLNQIDNTLLLNGEHVVKPIELFFQYEDTEDFMKDSYYVDYSSNTNCPQSINYQIVKSIKPAWSLDWSYEYLEVIASDRSDGDYVLKSSRPLIAKPMNMISCEYLTSLKDDAQKLTVTSYVGYSKANYQNVSLGGTANGWITSGSFPYTSFYSYQYSLKVTHEDKDGKINALDVVTYNNVPYDKESLTGMTDYEYILSGKCPAFAYITLDNTRELKSQYEILLTNFSSPDEIDFGLEDRDNNISYKYSRVLTTEESMQQLETLKSFQETLNKSVSSSRSCLVSSINRDSCSEKIYNASIDAVNMLYFCRDEILPYDLIHEKDERKTICNTFVNETYVGLVDEGVIESSVYGCGLISMAVRNWLYAALAGIRVIGVLGLIILTMLDFLKAVTASDEAEMKKTYQRTIKRGIAAIALFILPALVEFILNQISNFGFEGIDPNNPLCR